MAGECRGTSRCTHKWFKDFTTRCTAFVRCRRIPVRWARAGASGAPRLAVQIGLDAGELGEHVHDRTELGLHCAGWPAPRHLRALEPASQRILSDLGQPVGGRCPIGGAEREREVQQQEEIGVAEAPRSDAGGGLCDAGGDWCDGSTKGCEPGRREAVDSPCEGSPEGSKPEHELVPDDADGTEP